MKETIDYHIKSTWLNIFKMYNQIASKFDTSQATGAVLLNIEKEGTPSTKIATNIGLEATSLSRILKNLEDQNLIYKKTDHVDKRVSLVFLTEEGIKKRKIAKQIVSGFNEKIVQSIPQSKLSVFYEVMENINKIVEAYKKENL
jgi:DNA-binding MarR family transcriptional regulator